MTLIGTNGTHNVNLDQITDTLKEGDETLEFRVISAHNEVYGPATGDHKGATLTIEDDEPRIVWTLSKTYVVEGGGDQQLTITASLADNLTLPIDTILTVVVGEDTSGGYPSARLGHDFEPVPPFDIVIPANTNSSHPVTFTLSPIADDDEEGNETLAITGVADDLPAEHCPTTNCFYTIPSVTVTVSDAVPAQQQTVDQHGKVTLSAISPYEGLVLTATLSDPDGDVSGEIWQWQRSPDQYPQAWGSIQGANSASYTVTAADVGRFLRAAVNYDDGHDGGKSAISDATAPGRRPAQRRSSSCRSKARGTPPRRTATTPPSS